MDTKQLFLASILCQQIDTGGGTSKKKACKRMLAKFWFCNSKLPCNQMKHEFTIPTDQTKLRKCPKVDPNSNF